MSTTKEVTRGVFDPRTYREVDPDNSARKRRSDWLAIPGQIHYVRERTVASEDREMEEQAKKENEESKEEVDPKEEQHVNESEEIAPEIVKEREPIIEKKEATVFWPRKKRSDITMSRYVWSLEISDIIILLSYYIIFTHQYHCY